MKNVITMLIATSSLAFAGSAFAADSSAEIKSKVEHKKDGGYEATREAKETTPEGTKLKTESKVDVDVDSKGHINKSVKTESSADPKGLMNEKKTVSKSESEEKDRGGFKETSTTQQTDADGTDKSSKTTVDVAVDGDGNVTETTESKKTTDPKGLMNKTTTTSKTKMVNGKVVEQKKEVN